MLISVTIGGSCHKYHFFVMANTSLSRQTHVCYNKHVFVMTKHVFCCDKNACCNKHAKHVFVMTKLSSQQIFVATNIILLGQKFCCNKHTFVVTNTCLSFQNTSFVVTKVCLSQQNYVCHNKYLLRQKVCRDKICLSRLKFCRDKHIFVTTKDLFCRNKIYTCGSSHQ